MEPSTSEKPGLIYQHPWLYQAMLWAVHGKHLAQRYRKIAAEVGEVHSVFEPMCGPALLPRYLPPQVSYTGFDINPVFVNYATKKGHTAYLGDARTDVPFSAPVDAVVLVDALHHIHPYEEQQRVVERSARIAKRKIVICDPFGDRYLDLIQKFPFLQPLARWFYNWVEQDGPNESRYEHMIRRDTLEARMVDGFGILRGVKNTISQLGPEDLIATYTL